MRPVPHLVRIHRERNVPDWNTFAILGCIELERHHDDNPRIPESCCEPTIKRGETLFLSPLTICLEVTTP